MKNQVLNRFVSLIFIAVIIGIFTVPTEYFSNFLGKENTIVKKLEEFKITLGLDLAGGTELDYKIDLAEAQAQNSDSDATNDININNISESVRDALEARVNPAGVGEIVVKRSRVDEEEHILIQMPPSSNVEKAKQDAEKDNRLEFFEEDPSAVMEKRVKIATLMTTTLTPENWETKTKEIEEKDTNASLENFGPFYQDEITDEKFAQKLFSTSQGQIVQEIADIKIDPIYSIDEKGQIKIDGIPYPRNVLGIAYVTEKIEKNREKTTPATASARHILIAYPGAANAGKDLPYKTKEEAQKKAEELLEQIKAGANFSELAKAYSNDTSNKEKGGDLGSFTAKTMVKPFSDAVFNAKTTGLVANTIETNFGFHIIDVTDLQPEKKEVLVEPQIKYQMLLWNKDDISWKKTALGGKQLEIARVGYNEVSQPLVDLQFDTEGGVLFGEITGRLATKKCNEDSCRLGIRVGGIPISLPYVHQKITGRSAQITGNFTYKSAQDLADSLNLGAIDAPVVLSGQTTIKAELGSDQLEKSIKAAGFGLAAIIVFIIAMYRLAGVVATIALLFYVGLFVTLLKIWPADLGGPIVLTLAGAAGITLSMGLAVDGNILIFERMKEEVRRGRSILQAIDLGFERAWPAIRDSNLTTLISCIILFSLGSSIMKGFAITLIVGTLLSMFTAITISRNLLRLVLLIPGTNDPRFFGLSKKFMTEEKNIGAKIRNRH